MFPALLARRTMQAPLQAGHLADGRDATTRRAPAQQAHRARSALRFLPLLSLLLAMWACGFEGLRGAASLPVTHRPASALRLVIQIYGQYTNRPYVAVLVRVFDGTNPNYEVAVAQQAHVTCNGSDIKSGSQASQRVVGSCPRQPPGGSYQITYTDEHGASATVVVPIALGSFAILSPLAGATVPIPTDGPLTIRYVAPFPPTNGSVAIDGVSATCSTPVDACGTVYASLPHGATPTPGGGVGFSAATARPGRGLSLAAARAVVELATATPAPGATFTPGATATPPAPGATPTPGATSTPGAGSESSTATVTQSGNLGTITLTGDYSRFHPGPGHIDLTVEAQVTTERGGFAAVTVSFIGDSISSAVTWTR